MCHYAKKVYNRNKNGKHYSTVYVELYAVNADDP